MKKHFLILLLFSTAIVSAQVQVTKEGYPKFPKKEPTTTVASTDTLMISKVDGIQMGISWGDITAGLAGGSETDPVFSASDVFPVTSDDISNWNNAFGWGDHAAAAYLTSGDVVDTTSPQLVDGQKTFGSSPIFDATLGASSGNTFLNLRSNPITTYGPSTNFGAIHFNSDGTFAISQNIAGNLGGNLRFDFTALTGAQTVVFRDQGGTVAYLSDITGGSSTIAGATDTDLVALASGEILQWNGSLWVNVPAPSGGVSTEQQNRINNENRFFDFLVTADGDITNENVEVTSSGNEGLKGIISNLDDIIVRDLEDTDIPVGATLIVQNDGPSADTTIRFADGETGQFTGSTGSGNQIQLVGWGDFTILHKRAGFYRVSGNGTIGTVSSAIYQGSNAFDPVDNQDNTNGVNPGSGFTVASIADPNDPGQFMLEFTRTLATGTAAQATIDLPGSMTDATSFTLTFFAEETVGDQFDVGMFTSDGWVNVDLDQPITGSGEQTVVIQNTTDFGQQNPSRLRVRSFAGGDVGHKLTLRKLVITTP